MENLNIKYKFLLHKLDFSNLRSVKPKELEDVSDIESKTDPGFIPKLEVDLPEMFLADPVDFEDPNSKLYWRNLINDKKYFEDFEVELENMREKMVIAMGNTTGTFSGPLTPEQEKYSLPEVEYDISPAVNKMIGFKVDLNDFSNLLSLELKQQSLEISPEENDIIEVQISRNSQSFYTIYYGFITGISYTTASATVPISILSILGISKLLGLTRVIKDRAIANQFVKGEMTVPDFAYHQDFFNDKNAGEIFDYIAKNTLAYRAVKEPELKIKRIEIQNLEIEIGDLASQIANNEQTIKVKQDTIEQNEGTNDQKKLDAIPIIQKEIKDLQQQITADSLQLTNKKVTLETKKNDLKNNLLELEKEALKINYQFDEKAFSTISDFKTNYFVLYLYYLVKQKREGKNAVTAILEHGEHLVYNKALRNGYRKFYSQLAMPHEVLNVLRTTTMYDLFEQRDGKIIMRPPKYNQLEYVVNTDVEKATRVILGNDIKNYGFNKQDASLKTRADYKFMRPYIGTFDFIGGRYTEPNLLIKYGMRADEPKDNPNVINPRLGHLYSTLGLVKHNAATRTLSIVVHDNKDYELGKLYFIHPLARVGYLISIATDYASGSVATHTLTFTFVRNVYLKTIDTVNDAINAFYIYGESLTDSINKYFKEHGVTQDLIIDGFVSGFFKGTARKIMYDNLLQYFNDKHKGESFLVFRTIPTAMDIIDFMEFDETLAEVQETDPKQKDKEGNTSESIDVSKERQEKLIYEAEFSSSTHKLKAPYDSNTVNYMIDITTKKGFSQEDDLLASLTSAIGWKGFGVGGGYEEFLSSIYGPKEFLYGSTTLLKGDTALLTPLVKDRFNSRVLNVAHLDEMLVNALTTVDLNLNMYGFLNHFSFFENSWYFKYPAWSVEFLDSLDENTRFMLKFGYDTSDQLIISNSLFSIARIKSDISGTLKRFYFSLPKGIIIAYDRLNEEYKFINISSGETYLIEINSLSNSLDIYRERDNKLVPISASLKSKGLGDTFYDDHINIETGFVFPFATTSTESLNLNIYAELYYFSPALSINSNYLINNSGLYMGYRTDYELNQTQKSSANQDKNSNREKDLHNKGLAVDFATHLLEFPQNNLGGEIILSPDLSTNGLVGDNEILYQIFNSIFDDVQVTDVPDVNVGTSIRTVRVFHCGIKNRDTVWTNIENKIQSFKSLFEGKNYRS